MNVAELTATWRAANERNFVGFAAAYARAGGGSAWEAAGARWCDSHTPLAYFTGIFGATLTPDQIPIVARQAREHFGEQRWGWWTTPLSQPTDLSDRLAALGLPPLWRDEAMVTPLADLAWAEPPPDVTVAPVRDSAEMATWLTLFAAGFGFDDSAGWYRRLALAAFQAGGPVGPYLIARLGGEPVGTACLYVTDQTAGLYEVSTLPAARRRGIGAALTLATMRAGRERGCALGVLQASAMGAPVYRRLGFQSVGWFTAHMPVGRS